MGVGTDNIDVEAAKARGIPVGNTPDVLTDATADLAFALLLALARRIVPGAEKVRAGEWRTWEPAADLGADLAGAVLGIVGWGRIGQATARRAEGFGMEIVHSSRSSGVPLGELLERADFVSLHTPLTPETRHLIDADALARMKPTALLVNTARGGVVDQDALRAALHRRPRSPARRSTSPTPSRCRPTTRCSTPRTCSWCRTSAPPPCAPVRGWRRWRLRTCWPRSTAARCPTRSREPRRGRRHRHELHAPARRRARRRRAARAPARVDRHPARRGRRRDRPARRGADAARVRRARRLRARRSSATARARARRS